MRSTDWLEWGGTQNNWGVLKTHPCPPPLSRLGRGLSCRPSWAQRPWTLLMNLLFLKLWPNPQQEPGLPVCQHRRPFLNSLTGKFSQQYFYRCFIIFNENQLSPYWDSKLVGPLYLRCWQNIQILHMSKTPSSTHMLLLTSHPSQGHHHLPWPQTGKRPARHMWRMQVLGFDRWIQILVTFYK